MNITDLIMSKEFWGLVAFILVFVTAYPIERLRDRLFNDYPLLNKLLSCALCFGFWAGLVWYLDVFTACIVAVVAEGVYRLIWR